METQGHHVRVRSATLSPEIVYPCGNVWKNFEAGESNQLSISKGDIIVVTERSGNYWWWGTNESTQVSGYFPKDHLWFHTPWRRAFDNSHKRDYFVNVITGKSVWEVPVGFVENDEVTPADLIVEDNQKVSSSDVTALLLPVTEEDEEETGVDETRRSSADVTSADDAVKNTADAIVDVPYLKRQLNILRRENIDLRKRNRTLEDEVEHLKTEALVATQNNGDGPKRRTITLQDNGDGKVKLSLQKIIKSKAKSSKKKRGTMIGKKLGMSTIARMSVQMHAKKATLFSTIDIPKRRASKRMSMSSQNSIRLMPTRGRREEVTAEVIGKHQLKAAAASQQKISSKITSSMRMFLSEAIANNVLFLQLEQDILSKVVEGFEMEECSSNTDIIVQGDRGEYFYVVQSGECHVLIEHQGMLKQNGLGDILGHDSGTGSSVQVGPVLHGVITCGGTFGELALMYNTPRQATIRAVDQTTLWKISRQTFQLIIATHERERKKKFTDLIRGVPMLSNLSPSQLSSLAGVVGTETFSTEEPVFLAGENSTMLYIVETGNVQLRLMKRGKSGSFLETSKDINATSTASAASDASTMFTTQHSQSAENQMIRPSVFNKLEENKLLTSGQYFGIEAILSAASNDEHLSKTSAFAVSSNTQLVTLTADDLMRIVGKEWIRNYATDLPSKKGSYSDKVKTVITTEKNSNSINTTEENKLGTNKMRGEGHSSNESIKQDQNTEGEESDTLGRLPSSFSSTDSFLGRARNRSRTVSEYSVAELPTNWRDSSIGSLEDLELMQIIGKGSFGEVLLAKLKGTERLLAIKKLKKADLASSGCTPHVMNERKALAISQGCPFIINLFTTFADKRYLYFVLELCRGGDLFGLLCKCERIVEKDARFYVATVLNAFAYMHEKDIIYRDLKPENLLITESGYLKVADLGLAKAVPDGVTYTMCGTPVYMAPEMLLSSGHGKAADAWAIGIMIYELCGGFPPFEGEDQMTTYELIINASLTWPTMDVAGAASSGAKKMDDDREDDSGRLTDLWGSLSEIVPAYKFGSSMKELIQNLLVKEPARRAGVAHGATQKPFEDVMKCRWFSGFDWTAFYKQKMTPPVLPHVGDWLENFEEYDEEEQPIEYNGHDFDEFDQ